MFLMSLLFGCDSTLTLVVKDETGGETTESGDNDGNGHSNETDCETTDPGEEDEEVTEDPTEEPEVEADPKASCVAVEEQTYYSRNQISAQYELTHTYDELGREIETSYDYNLRPGADYVLGYVYDDHNNIVEYTYTYSRQGITYTYEYLYVYDTNDRLVQTGYDYDNNGTFEYMTYYTYDDSGLSRQGLIVYDYGYVIYNYTFEEILDEDGHVLQQEMDNNGDGQIDSRVTNLYAGDLLLEYATEYFYDYNQDGMIDYYYSYSVVYDYDSNGFLTGTGQDYDGDGADDYQILYTNNADGQPTLIEYVQTVGFHTYRSTEERSYDAAGHILNMTFRNSQNRIYMINDWTWTCGN